MSGFSDLKLIHVATDLTLENIFKRGVPSLRSMELASGKVAGKVLIVGHM